MVNTLRQVGAALYNLDTIDKYEKEFHRNPSIFKVRANISNEIFEVKLNDVIKTEIQKFIDEERLKNKKIVDENPVSIEAIKKLI